jgi:hypothetical protein
VLSTLQATPCTEVWPVVPGLAPTRAGEGPAGSPFARGGAAITHSSTSAKAASRRTRNTWTNAFTVYKPYRHLQAGRTGTSLDFRSREPC